MVPASPSSVTVYKRAPAAGAGPGASLTIVWLRGEQGTSTDAALCRALARAAVPGRYGLDIGRQTGNLSWRLVCSWTVSLQLAVCGDPGTK
jgi:hypothetical protein